MKLKRGGWLLETSKGKDGKALHAKSIQHTEFRTLNVTFVPPLFQSPNVWPNTNNLK